MAHFDYTTVWRIAAPRREVWGAIFHSERWPEWWDAVKEVVELKRGDLDGTGNLRHYVWQGRLPYRIAFEMRTTRVQPFTLLEGVASGDVEGTGCWDFSEQEAVTVVRYRWNVRTTGRSMSLAASLGRPLVRWNHDQIMSAGGRALARLLNARLVEVRHA